MSAPKSIDGPIRIVGFDIEQKTTPVKGNQSSSLADLTAAAAETRFNLPEPFTPPRPLSPRKIECNSAILSNTSSSANKQVRTVTPAGGMFPLEL